MNKGIFIVRTDDDVTIDQVANELKQTVGITLVKSIKIPAGTSFKIQLGEGKDESD